VMSSRAAPSVRADPKRVRATRGTELRDFPVSSDGWREQAVCKRCKLIMANAEPMARDGEFHHIAKPHQTRAARCVNANRTFHMQDKEIEPFMRKARRRALKRSGIRA
jgi:hypothetical protein